MHMELCVCLFACEQVCFQIPMILWPSEYTAYQCVGGTGPAVGGQGEGAKSKSRARQGERHSMRPSASLWSDIITCSSPGRSPWLACVWEMADHINITKYRTWLWKKRWRRSRCTVPLGLGRFKLKAQYSLSQSVGVQTVPSKRVTMGRSRRGGTQHSLGTQDREEAFNRIEMKLN